MLNNDWNGASLTEIRVGHTISFDEKQPPLKKQKVVVSDQSLGLTDGSRLTMIRHASSPYMAKEYEYSVPKPPAVLLSYSASLTNAAAPFRVTIAGTIHDVEEAEPTNAGDLRRSFKLADDSGKWVHCIAVGRHAESDALTDMNYIVGYFGNGRTSAHGGSQAIWFFKDSFLAPVHLRLVTPLSQQVLWQ